MFPRQFHCMLSRATLCVAITIVLVGCRGSSESAPRPVPTVTVKGTVVLEIDDGVTTQTFEIEEVAEGTTVESLMRSFDQLPVTINGSGTTAFVDQIGEKATGSQEGWVYRVDGEFANQGIGRTQLTPPTTVSWSYGEQSF